MRTDPGDSRATDADGKESAGDDPSDEIDKDVDEQSEESFPASDPPSY